jgi:hypothetical protein
MRVYNVYFELIGSALNEHGIIAASEDEAIEIAQRDLPVELVNGPWTIRIEDCKAVVTELKLKGATGETLQISTDDGGAYVAFPPAV